MKSKWSWYILFPSECTLRDWQYQSQYLFSYPNIQIYYLYKIASAAAWKYRKKSIVWYQNINKYIFATIFSVVSVSVSQSYCGPNTTTGRAWSPMVNNLRSIFLKNFFSRFLWSEMMINIKYNFIYTYFQRKKWIRNNE